MRARRSDEGVISAHKHAAGPVDASARLSSQSSYGFIRLAVVRAKVCLAPRASRLAV